MIIQTIGKKFRETKAISKILEEEYDRQLIENTKVKVF